MRVIIDFKDFEPREAAKTKFDALVRAIGLDGLEAHLEVLGDDVEAGTINDYILYQFDDICEMLDLDVDEVLSDEETIEEMDPEEGLFKNETLREIAARVDKMVEAMQQELQNYEDSEYCEESFDEIMWRD